MQYIITVPYKHFLTRHSFEQSQKAVISNKNEGISTQTTVKASLKCKF